MAARCPTHPDSEAVLACSRCGGFACSRCTVHLVAPTETADVCLKCRTQVNTEMLRRKERPSLLAGAAFWVALAFPLLGLLAVVLGAIELRRINRGESTPVGRGWATFGVVVGGLWGAIALLILVGRW